MYNVLIDLPNKLLWNLTKFARIIDTINYADFGAHQLKSSKFVLKEEL